MPHRDGHRESLLRRLRRLLGEHAAVKAVVLGVTILVGGLLAGVLRSYSLGWRWTLAPAVGAGLLVLGCASLVAEHLVIPWESDRRLARRLGQIEGALRPADRADDLTAAIFKFERRDPEGNVIADPMDLRDILETLARPGTTTAETEQETFARFDDLYGAQLRSMFHEFARLGWVQPGELALFYTPRKAADRVALAHRLRQIARTGRAGA